MLRKLRNKMLIVNMALLSFVMIVSFSVIYAITYSNTQAENQRKLEMAPGFSTIGEPGAAQGSGEKTIHTSGIAAGYTPSFVLTVDNNGRLIEIASFLDLSNETYQEAYEKAWTGKQSAGKMTLADRKWQYAVTQTNMITQNNGRISEQKYWQIVFLDITDTEASLTQLLITFAFVGLGMLVVLFLISYWFSNRAIQPIEESWQKQKQFVADASHELKTPIAVISANMDAIEASGEETVNSQKEWLSYIRAELGRMGKLTGDMLYLAKTEDTKEELLTFDFGFTCETVVASIEALLYDKNIKLHTDIEKNVPVRGDMERIKQAVFILLDNASKYTNENGEITVTLKKSKGHAVFSVKNTGKGIRPDDLPKIFDRFYRPDSSRSEESGGYGLGLSIAKTIVERAGGEITAQSVIGLTTFTIALKLGEKSV